MKEIEYDIDLYGSIQRTFCMKKLCTHFPLISISNSSDSESFEGDLAVKGISSLLLMKICTHYECNINYNCNAVEIVIG